MRLLQAEEAAPPPEAMAVDSDVMVILAALLCALICVVGLALVARCAWLRRSLSGGSAPTQLPPDKGLKKKVLRSLPKLSFAQATAAEKLSAECPICLAEFADGDEIRILPQCGHAFHVVCIDTWLGSHSSCPSCRQGFAATASAAKCERCGGSPAVEVGAKAREDRDANTFLP